MKSVNGYLSSSSSSSVPRPSVNGYRHEKFQPSNLGPPEFVGLKLHYGIAQSHKPMPSKHRLRGKSVKIPLHRQGQVFDSLTLQYFCIFAANSMFGGHCLVRLCYYIGSFRAPKSVGSRTLQEMTYFSTVLLITNPLLPYELRVGVQVYGIL